MERGGGNEKKDDDSPVPTTNRPSVVREDEELHQQSKILREESATLLHTLNELVDAHPGILECRGDGERAGQSQRGRDSARRSTFAPAEQHRARRTRPGVGAPGTPL